MKAYMLKEDDDFEYPQDMEEILRYLKNHGELYILPKTVESYYRDFCDEYYSANWISVISDNTEEFDIDSEYWWEVDDILLEKFAKYLSEIEI